MWCLLVVQYYLAQITWYGIYYPSIISCGVSSSWFLLWHNWLELTPCRSRMHAPLIMFGLSQISLHQLLLAKLKNKLLFAKNRKLVNFCIENLPALCRSLSTCTTRVSKYPCSSVVTLESTHASLYPTRTLKLLNQKFAITWPLFVLVCFGRRRNGSHMRSCQKHKKPSSASCCWALLSYVRRRLLENMPLKFW
jgi:hypothetical protein